VLGDRWDLVAVHVNQDADFRERVMAAIAAGTGFVREAIDEKKSFLVDTRRRRRTQLRQRPARAGPAHDGPRTLPRVGPRARARLRRAAETAHRGHLLAGCGTHGDGVASCAARRGRTDPRRPVGGGRCRRKLDERDHKVAQKWVKQLLENIDPRTDPAQVLRFNYTAGPRYDNLAAAIRPARLWSAQMCGIELPPGVVSRPQRASCSRCRDRRTDASRCASPTYAELREVAGTDHLPGGPAQNAKVRGFAYEQPTEPPFGSMTSAGISGLLLARAGMSAQGGADRALVTQIEDAVRDGFAWLASEFTVRSNPGFAERADHHWYYWLYGLERSCELATIARLHDSRLVLRRRAAALVRSSRATARSGPSIASSLLLDAYVLRLLFLAKSTVVAPGHGHGALMLCARRLTGRVGLRASARLRSRPCSRSPPRSRPAGSSCPGRSPAANTPGTLVAVLPGTVSM
jgi:hypothetical protein